LSERVGAELGRVEMAMGVDPHGAIVLQPAAKQRSGRPSTPWR
jgi:hypothetical protein